MQTSLHREVSELREAVEVLLQREEEQRAAQGTLLSRVQALEQENRHLRENLELCRGAEAISRTAASFGPGSEDSTAARKLVNQLMREIDSCIALLRD